MCILPNMAQSLEREKFSETMDYCVIGIFSSKAQA